MAAPGPGRLGEIRVFTLEGVERTSFRIAPFGAMYRDGRAEVIVGSGIGMAPTVMVYDVSGSPRVVDAFRPLSAAYQAFASLAKPMTPT